MKLFLALSLCATLFSAHAAIRVGTYNIRNFDYDERSRVPTNKQKLAETLKKVNADFLGVQEINQDHVFISFIDRTFFGQYDTVLSECGGAHGQKLGFVYNKNMFELISFEEDLRVSNPHSPRQGWCNSGSRPLAVGTFRVKKTGEVFVAVSVHLKSGGQQSSINKRFKQLEILGKLLGEKKKRGIDNFVVMGDFNSTEYIFNGHTAQRFAQVVNKMGLNDVSANLACTAYWWGGYPDQKQYPSQLDHILVSKNFGKSGTATTQSYGHCAKLSCNVTHERDMGVSFDEVSDHCPIVTTLN